MSRPARGTECARCRARGHRCEAVLYAALEQDGPELPVCLACADGEPCAAERCAGLGRTGSSVRVEQDVFGDVIEPGQAETVVHRTPDELGLARTAPDVPPPPAPRRVTSVDWAPKRARSTMSERRLRRDPVPARAVPERVIRGVRVRMPANACMGAQSPRERGPVRGGPVEMIDGFARELEAQKGVEMKGPGGQRVALTDEQKAAIVEASDIEQNIVVAERFGVNASTVSTLRTLAGRAPKPRGGVPERRTVPSTAICAVPIEPGRPGTAAALLDALARNDTARAGETVTLTLTHEQLGEIVRGLAPHQVAAMIAAGLPAALATKAS